MEPGVLDSAWPRAVRQPKPIIEETTSFALIPMVLPASDVLADESCSVYIHERYAARNRVVYTVSLEAR